METTIIPEVDIFTGEINKYVELTGENESDYMDYSKSIMLEETSDDNLISTE